jgi:type IV pilus assembly protein PilE
MHRTQQQGGFSLIELLVAIVVLGLLLSIAVPNYSAYVERSRRSDARAALLEIASAQERIYFERNQYSAAIADVWAHQEGGSYVSSEGYYTLTVVLTDKDPNRFTATATARGRQSGDEDCASFAIDDTGLKSATGDAADTCW